MALLKIGHRGAKAHVAENTFESFQKALEMGVHGIEMDVHVCATGELVVIHDYTVDRTTNGTGEVHLLSLAQLKELIVEGQYIIPTLAQVLDLLNGKCFVNIEMKGRHTAQPVSDIIEKYVAAGNYGYNDFIVSSFQREELEAMSRINPNVPLAVLTQASVAQALEWAAEFSAKAIHPHYTLLTETNIKRAKEAGLQLNTWTVNEPFDIERMISYGVDGIISDYPERL